MPAVVLLLAVVFVEALATTIAEKTMEKVFEEKVD